MGNQLSTDTLCSTADSQGNSYWVGIDWKSFAKGSNKKCYQGLLNGRGPRAGEKVVVKAFRDSQGQREIWHIEKLKAKTTQVLANVFSSWGGAKVKVNLPLVALMDSVSKMNDIMGYRSRSRSLNDDEWVGIEEFITGKFKRFCSSDPAVAHDRDAMMEAFSHFTFHQSQGAYVICDFKGTAKEDGTYHVTNPVIHSHRSQFGAKDMGTNGINEFFKVHRCNDFCRQWPRMQPLSPPPSFEDIFAESSALRAIPSAPPLGCEG